MCPGCGAIRGRCVQTGYDADDRVIRLRRCETCDEQYTTVELVVPGSGGTGAQSFYRLCDSLRLRQINRMRLIRGYHNTRQGRYSRQRPRLEVDVRVVSAVRRPQREAS